MNQEHPQPSPVDYENGNPDSWAETPVPADKMSVKGEYDGDHVKRNEVGFGEFREDTWKHKDSDQWNGKGKYDNAKTAAERRAMACERLARATLRTADDKLIEGATIDLMALPDKSIVAMLKRLDAVSPNSLPEQSKFKRALACTKLAARMLGATATAKSVEQLGSIMMSVDDPTLKSIIRTVASARLAQEEQQQEEQQGKTSQQEEQQQEEVKTSQQEEQQEEGQQEEEGTTSQEQQEAHGLNAEEMAMLDSMLNSEGDEACAPCPPAVPAPGGDDLSALFSGAPAAPAAMPMTASDISFDDGDDSPDPKVASDALDSLFADDPEVQAQREIQASGREAAARVSGFGRVASSNGGAKKLGAVKNTAKASVDTVLENLWERP